MATGMQIDNKNLPAPMDAGGTYRFEYEKLGRSGMGLDIDAATATVTWQWPMMTLADFTWWNTTLLGGQRSAQFSQAKLFNQLQVLTTFTACVVHRPTYQEIRSGAYYDVAVEITNIS